MKITKRQLIRLIKETVGDHLSPADDFIKEVSWYQSQGIGGNISKQDMIAIYNNSPVTPVNPSSLDNFANSYTSLINGSTPEERFRQFVDFYLAEQRSADTTRASDNEGKIKYLQSLVNATEKGLIDKPINVLNVEGVGSFISGGRTRASAAKVAGVPVIAKIITIPAEAINDVEAVKGLHAMLQI